MTDNLDLKSENFNRGWKALHVKSADGLNLFVRDYAASPGDALPVVCLAGLTRNSIDFHPLALALSQDLSKPRRVIAVDSRGRGASDSDPDWTHYNLGVELADCLAVLNAAEIQKAIFVGTSRGGLLTMTMAALRPDLIAAAVLNDIGPVLEVPGLRRIQGYVGKLVQPQNYDEAVKILKFVAGGQFDNISEAEWQYFAFATWAEGPAGLTVRYDINLAKPFQETDLSKPVPDMWPQFEALKPVPVLTIRGEKTDLFSAETQSEMCVRHPDCAAYTVPGQGHAPLLLDETSINRIRQFIAEKA